MGRAKCLEEALEVDMTPKQREVFLVVDEWWRKFGFGPSIDDIMNQTGDKGRGNVARVCKALCDLGICKRLPNRARSIRPSYLRIRDIE
jgi:SOS-response transcriptional repressor LexA